MKEGFSEAVRHPENQNPAKQSALQIAEKILRDADVIDPGRKIEAPSVSAGSSDKSFRSGWYTASGKFISEGFFS